MTLERSMKGMKKQNKVVVAGAGTMGASLAQVYARAGWDTVLYNRSASGLERAKASRKTVSRCSSRVASPDQSSI